MTNAYSGYSLNQVLQIFESIAPLDLAEPWDHVGLIIDQASHKKITRLLLTLDITPDVVNEAVRLKVDLILTYHPILFTPIQRMNRKTPQGNMLLKLISHNIGIYSPHTALDKVKGGVSDWLSQVFTSIKRLSPIYEDLLPTSGRFIELTHKATLKQLVQQIKTYLNLSSVRIALASNHQYGKKQIQRIALCPGAGSSVILPTKADLYFTGEMKHHDILAAINKGISVILCEHASSERAYLKPLKQMLDKAFSKKIEILLSKKDQGPLFLF